MAANNKKKDLCDLSIRIGGEAGQGMNSITGLLGKAFVRRGLHVFINQDVMSRIRGGHNYTQIRIGDRPVNGPSARVDILVCLDKNTLDLYRDSVDGLIVYDPGKVKEGAPSGRKFLPLPMEKIAEDIGGSARMANTVACGALMALTGLPLEPLLELLGEVFSQKGDKVIQANRECAQEGYERMKDKRGELPACGLPPSDKAGPHKMLVTGSEAMALGALAANVRFYSAYPMSPATAIMEYLAAKQKEFGIVVEQAEDEIAAVNMAIGAFFGGARAMTGTSGGGLALMVEGISLAGMTETPLVLVDCQRPAPATGFPTRTEQADLLYVAHCAHGEFPRAILAPGNAEQAFRSIGKAFYLAEKYQTPVFVLGDQHLNDSSWTAEPFAMDERLGETQSLVSEQALKGMKPYEYARYEITDSGISPRLLPGTPGQVLYADSDEHTEEGHITESAEVRNAMVEKRLRKLAGMRAEMAGPAIFPDSGAGSYLVCWGSTLGAVDETVRELRAEGADWGYIHFSELYPLPAEPIPRDIARKARLVAVENNALGQICRLLRMETGLAIEERILKYDGRPFTPEELRERLEGAKR
jgi:2-oxoglutarate/2-oxoacid ferredoxin oxidoreductase subunit alpha